MVALDIETLGIASSAVILSVAAVEVRGDREFSWVFDPRLQTERTISPDTVMWWLQQPRKARRDVLNPTGDGTLPTGLALLKEFLGSAKVFQWGTLDMNILNHAYHQVHGGSPNTTCVTEYTNVVDARSIFMFMGHPRPKFGSHTALGDAKALAEALRNIPGGLDVGH